MKISPIKKFNKEITVPGDKSITQRAILLSTFSRSKVKITNALLGEDCLNCVKCISKLGAKAEVDAKTNTITIEGIEKLKSTDLFVGNSGTAIRLLAGLLAPQKGHRFLLDGDSSIRKRPMGRVMQPLRQMGASMAAVDSRAPIAIEGAGLSGVNYVSPVASAQVKSAILLAGLFADGKTTVVEPYKSRDHTERMLKYFGINVQEDNNSATVFPSIIKAKDIKVCGDISSAAFLLVLAACINGGRVKIKSVGVNKTRDGILRVLRECGASFRLDNTMVDSGEDVADITLEQAMLKPFTITKELVPLLIDEIPILAVLACFIEGKSIIKGAEELKYKESNRIDTTVDLLKKMGASIEATDDGMIIHGSGRLKGGVVIDSFSDHRIAMSAAVAGALSLNGVQIKGAECVSVSFPNFYEVIK